MWINYTLEVFQLKTQGVSIYFRSNLLYCKDGSDCIVVCAYPIAHQVSAWAPGRATAFLYAMKASWMQHTEAKTLQEKSN